MGVLCLSLFCYALLCVLSGFVMILKMKRKLVTKKCYVALPHEMHYVIVVFQDHSHLL